MSTILDMNHVYKDFYSLDEERQILKDINIGLNYWLKHSFNI